MPIVRKAKYVIQSFIESESSGGLVLMGAAALGMIVANSPLAEDYDHILHTYLGGLSVLHWINDGLMVIFFFVVGLEVKRELVVGHLSSPRKAVLPVAAALFRLRLILCRLHEAPELAHGHFIFSDFKG